MSIAKKEDLLSQIAWKTFAPGDYFFKTEQVKRYISEYIRNLPGANLDDEALQGDSGIVLKNIEAQHGLLTARAKNIYSFSHLTFQEYFTAREIILVRQSSDEALQELGLHLFDKRWREVFLLAVSLSPNAERLVLLIKEKCDKLLAEDAELQQYLQWLQRKTAQVNFELSVADTKKIQKIYRFYTANNSTLARIFYLGLDLEYNLNLNLNQNLNLYLNLNLNRNLELAQEADPQLHVILLGLKQRLPEQENTSNEEFKHWWEANGEDCLADFRQAMIDHQDIGHDWQFSEEQKALLEQYYVANQLLTQCLKQDCYVRPEVRQEIEATLLLPYEKVGSRQS